MLAPDNLNLERCFGGVTRLYGEAGMQKIQTGHVMVLGMGGVGSWAAEALARSGVGKLTLIDLDNVAESNLNRQIQALSNTIGLAKVHAMRERIALINPSCTVEAIEDFIRAENMATLLQVPPTIVLDCMDDTRAKIDLANYCKRTAIKLVMSGSAGGKLDATRIRIVDLAQVQGDPMLAKVRNQLRRNYGFPKVSAHKRPAPFGFSCVYSDEPVKKPERTCDNNIPLSGLNCAGYGSSVCVTASFGMVMAQNALNMIVAKA